MGTVPSHSALLCVDHVGPRCSCCACDSTSVFCNFDIHSDTILKWLQGRHPMSLVEIGPLFFFAPWLSITFLLMFGHLGLRLV